MINFDFISVTHLCLMPKLRMRGARPPIPPICLHGVALN